MYLRHATTLSLFLAPSNLSVKELCILKCNGHLTSEHEEEVHAVFVEKAIVQTVFQIQHSSQVSFYHDWHTQYRFHSILQSTINSILFLSTSPLSCRSTLTI